MVILKKGEKAIRIPKIYTKYAYFTHNVILKDRINNVEKSKDIASSEDGEYMLFDNEFFGSLLVGEYEFTIDGVYCGILEVVEDEPEAIEYNAETEIIVYERD